MTLNSTDYYYDCIHALETLKTPYAFNKSLNQLLSSDNNKISEKIQKNIQFLSDRWGINPEEIGKPINLSFDLNQITNNSTTYFLQGLEMLKNSQTLSEMTSPVLQYYSYLQIIRGKVNSLVSLDYPTFNRFHGIKLDEYNNYIEGKFAKAGALQSLGIVEGDFLIGKNLYTENTKVSLPELLNEASQNNVNDPCSTFIISWMLSMIVRYNPNLWKQILEGKNDDIVLKIRDFQNEIFPKSIISLLQPFL